MGLALVAAQPGTGRVNGGGVSRHGRHRRCFNSLGHRTNPSKPTVLTGPSSLRQKTGGRKNPKHARGTSGPAN